jgi:hypothetical protein
MLRHKALKYGFYLHVLYTYGGVVLSLGANFTLFHSPQSVFFLSVILILLYYVFEISFIGTKFNVEIKLTSRVTAIMEEHKSTK